MRKKEKRKQFCKLKDRAVYISTTTEEIKDGNHNYTLASRIIAIDCNNRVNCDKVHECIFLNK